MPSLMHHCTAPTSPRRLLHSLGHYLLYRVQIAYVRKYVIGNYFAFGSRSSNCQSWKKLRGYTSHLVKLPLQNDIQHRTRQTCVLVKTNKEVSILISKPWNHVNLSNVRTPEDTNHQFDPLRTLCHFLQL